MEPRRHKRALFAMTEMTVGLLSVLLCLGAWSYKAEAAFALGLVGVVIGGTITRSLLSF